MFFRKMNVADFNNYVLIPASDNLYKLSLQTISADAFLKQRQTSPTSASPSPPPASLAYVTRNSYSSIVNNCKYVQMKTKHKNFVYL